MPEPTTPARRVTTVRELALRLLAGEPLRRCHGIGWTIGEAAQPVDAVVLRALGNGFRLAPAGDALPGFGAALSQTLLLEPLLDDSDLMARLRPAVRAAGGIGAYARLHGVGKSTVAMVEGAHRDMTTGIALTLGMLPHITWRADPARRRADPEQEAA